MGYASFGDQTASDILLNLSDRSVLVGVARLCVALSVATSYAILHFCARKVLLGRFGKQIRCLCGSQRAVGVPQPEGEGRRDGPFVLITTLWALSVVVLVILFPDVGQVVAFVGNLAACFMFIFPGIALCKLAQPLSNASRKPAAHASLASAPLLRMPEEAAHPSASDAVAARRDELLTSGRCFIVLGSVVFLVGVSSCVATALGYGP